MQQLSHGIYYENDYPGVTLGALVMPQGTLLIDAPLRAEDARSWRNALLSIGSSSRRMLVNLDLHTDRTLGARAMECTIIAHQNTADVFRGRPSIFKGQNAESGSEWENQNDSVGTRWAIPDITFSKNMGLHWGKVEILIEHHPGPTDGAVWVIVPEEQIIFIGDAVLPNQPAFLASADITSWQETLDQLMKDYRNYTLISGRSGPLPSEEVKKQKKHLNQVEKALEKLATKSSPASAIEGILPSLLSQFSYPASLSEQYRQRLQHGLVQYYKHQYLPVDDNEHS